MDALRIQTRRRVPRGRRPVGRRAPDVFSSSSYKQPPQPSRHGEVLRVQGKLERAQFLTCTDAASDTRTPARASRSAPELSFASVARTLTHTAALPEASASLWRRSTRVRPLPSRVRARRGQDSAPARTRPGVLCRCARGMPGPRECSASPSLSRNLTKPETRSQFRPYIERSLTSSPRSSRAWRSSSRGCIGFRWTSWHGNGGEWARLLNSRDL